MPRELTPLSTIAGFDEAIRSKLADLWITSAEEFHSAARSANAAHGNGRKALSLALAISEEQVRALADAVRAALPADTPFDVPVELEVGAGLITEGLPTVDASSFATVVDLPEQVEPLSIARALPPPSNQGQRNTCVTFTLASCYQILSGDPTDLSEQFLYYLCKEKDGIPRDVGTNPVLAMQLIRDVGICSEATWPYKPSPVDHSSPGHERPPEAAFAEAGRRRLSGFTQVPGNGSAGVTQLKNALAQGKPALIGLPIYEHWTGATQATILGRLRFPLPGESSSGGHAMCVVGYRDDESVPGGGYFIVRNSWGVAWGNENPDGAGYCHVPYLVLARHGLITLVADGVVAQPRAEPPRAEPASPGKASSRPRRPAAVAGATLGGSAEAPNGVAALYEEALQIKGLVDGLVARLAALVGGDPAAGDAPALDGGAAAFESAAPLPPRPAPSFSGPLILVSAAEDGRASEELYPNGIDGATGMPLLRIDARTAANLAQGKKAGPAEADLKSVYRAKQNAASGAHFGTVADVAQAKIEEARWAVVMSALEDTAVLQAAWPLVQHRMQQMGFKKTDFDFRQGETVGAWLNRHTDSGKKTMANSWGEVPPVLDYRPGERVNRWLARYGVSQGPVDPRRGVPFYLMLLARPGPLAEGDEVFIPLTFQYELDIFWGVGRLAFSGPDGQHRLADYTRYAERVVGFEKRQDAAERVDKKVVYFGTRHEEDNSTIRSADELVTPLASWHENAGNTPSKLGFARELFLAQEASGSNLAGVLRGGSAGKAPAVIFTATHGLGLPYGDERLVAHQGALVTQDWTGFGGIKRSHWFAAEDLAAMGDEARLEGTMAFLFACYGGGCPHQDEFIFDEQKGRPQIAPFPFIAQLPQQMLLSGSLAVLGHVERAWTYSFSGTEGAKAQSQGFEDVLGRLLQGKRAGDATDQFNIIQGARAMSLTEELENIKFGKIPDPTELSKLWMARNDARNYALLGDPAVKLPF